MFLWLNKYFPNKVLTLYLKTTFIYLLIYFFRTAVLGISFGMAFLILSIILLICFIGHFLVSECIWSKQSHSSLYEPLLRQCILCTCGYFSAQEIRGRTFLKWQALTPGDIADAFFF